MRSWFALTCSTALLFGQSVTSTTGSVSGTFVSPAGQALYGYVLLTGTPLGVATKKVFTSNGAFQFTGLPAGLYSICTRTTYAQAPSTEEPFLDSCEWPAFGQVVRLKAGQALTGVRMKAQPGVRLRLRVNASSAAAATLAPVASANAVDPNLELHVHMVDQFAHRLPVISSDAGGRDYAVVIPHDQYVTLRAKSTTLAVSDSMGKAVTADQQLFVQSGTLPAKLTLQVSTLP